MSAEHIASILDDLVRMREVDRKDMFRQVRELPEQCELSLGIARNFQPTLSESVPSAVFIAGVGDAAMAARMTAAVAADSAGAPIIVYCGTGLPAYVGERTLVVVVDYGGVSRVALRNYGDARARGAEVVCVASRGDLAEQAAADGVRIVRAPSGQPTRTGVGYLWVQLLALLAQYQVIESAEGFVDTAVRHLKNVRESLRVSCPLSRNLAKRTAESFYGKIPVIIGPAGYKSVVAARWKGQIGCNSKRPAFTNLPCSPAESELTAWEMTGDQIAEFAIVRLTDSLDRMGGVTDPLNRITDIVGGRCSLADIELGGATTAERMLYGIYLGDYVSCYLAMLYNVDPTPSAIPVQPEPIELAEPEE